MPTAPVIVGMVWYHPEDWDKLGRLFDDPFFKKPFDDWLKNAEYGFKDQGRRDRVVEKVYLDPEQFPLWCAECGLHVDAKARIRFANEAVARKYLKQG